MPVLWLPLDVTYKKKHMKVFIPDLGDRRETEDLIQYAKEKTEADLAKMTPKPVSKLSKEDIIGSLREYVGWLRHKKESPNKRLF